jgi:hypothetical protein
MMTAARRRRALGDEPERAAGVGGVRPVVAEEEQVALGDGDRAVVGAVVEDDVGLVERLAVDEDLPLLDDDLVALEADHALDEVAGAGRHDAEELADAADDARDRARRRRTGSTKVSPSKTTISPRAARGTR